MSKRLVVYRLLFIKGLQNFLGVFKTSCPCKFLHIDDPVLITESVKYLNDIPEVGTKPPFEELVNKTGTPIVREIVVIDIEKKNR